VDTKSVTLLFIVCKKDNHGNLKIKEFTCLYILPLETWAFLVTRGKSNLASQNDSQPVCHWVIITLLF